MRALQVKVAESSRSLGLFEEEQNYLAPGIQSVAILSRLSLEKGRGCRVWDVDGREYLDFLAGVGVASIGHAHPEYVRMVGEQLAKISVGSFTTPHRLSFLKTLVAHCPRGLDRAQLYSSGAEAVEAALRLAKSRTKKYEVIGFWGGFHGKTGGVLGVLGDSFKHELGPLMPGLYSVPYPNASRCPFKAPPDHDCAAHCLEFLDETIRRNTSGALAAVIAEPIQGTAGNIIPPPGFLKGLREITRRHGALLILDEMITGFGRTGKMFACEHEDVTPDILTVGKGMAAGFPVSGLITSSEIASSKPFANPSGSSSSYGGNPLASAAADATLSILLKESLIENSASTGAFLLKRLEAMKARCPWVADVRGRGLLIGLDLVADQETLAPLPAPICREIFEESLRRGLIAMSYNASVRINPPLCLTPQEAARGTDILESAIAAVAKRHEL